MSMPITAHFETAEFASHDGVAYPVDEVDDEDPEQRSWYFTRLLPLCNALEFLRQSLGGPPIEILSGYRSEAHNVAVGGAPHSQHVQGRAADIKVYGLAPDDVHAKLLELDSKGLIYIGGLGLYATWVHVDVRPRSADGHLARWEGREP